MEQLNRRNILLIVDDDEINRIVLGNIFVGQYEILEEENGRAALDIIDRHHRHIAAIMLDMMMPVMNGAEVVAELVKRNMMSEIPVFIVTAEPNASETEKMYDHGVIDVIGKPFVPYVTKRRVESVIELYEARELLSNTVEKQEAALVKSAKDLLNMTEGVIEALAAAIEFRSGETGAHVRNIRRITELMLDDPAFGSAYSDLDKRNIALASMLHDVGKISVPDAIMNKPGRFTPEERLEMQKHSEYGVAVLAQIPQIKGSQFYPFAVDIAHHHHERWDGKGYPEGLSGTEISVPSQIVGLADVYDALLSKRCYKEPYGREKALDMIKNGECGLFNPSLLDAFVKTEPVLWNALYE